MNKIILLSLIVFSQISFASMLPENSLWIPKSNDKNSSMTEERFNQLVDKVTSNYKDIILGHYGAKEFNIFKEWDSGKVNAATRKKEGKFELIVYGGLGRYEPLTDDGFLLVVCHEIGHLIGGAPTWKPFNKASSEGQADYFSTVKCFRKITWKDNNEKIVSKLRIDPFARAKCESVYKGETEKNNLNICLRSSKAQESLARVMEEMTNADKILNFDTPDPYVRMFILFNGYPNPQCRLDTVFAGSLCKNDHNELLELNLYNKGVCSESDGDKVGLRPKCWYVPREEDSQ